MSHRADDRTEQPICFVFRTLSTVEKKYSQLDKEALAIIFGVTKFHQYLYGRNCIIVTDHKPLTHIFNPCRSVPQMGSARLHRWALTWDRTSTRSSTEPEIVTPMLSAVFLCQLCQQKYHSLVMSWQL